MNTILNYKQTSVKAGEKKTIYGFDNENVELMIKTLHTFKFMPAVHII